MLDLTKPVRLIETKKPCRYLGRLEGEVMTPLVWAVMSKLGSEFILNTNGNGTMGYSCVTLLENYTPQKIMYKAVYIQGVEAWSSNSKNSIQEVINNVSRNSLNKHYSDSVFQGISKVTLENNIVIDISFMSLKDLKTQGYL